MTDTPNNENPTGGDITVNVDQSNPAPEQEAPEAPPAEEQETGISTDDAE